MKIGIIGSGAMGTGIAQVLSMASNQVVLIDSNALALEKAQNNLKNTFSKLKEKGKISAQDEQRFYQQITFESDYQSLQDADLIIEAIIEDIQVKKKLFKELESWVSDSCILATNTSSLSIASIAAACNLPERFIGIHFFNPAPLMALVEIIPAVQTDAQLANKVKNWVSTWGKLPVITKDTPGFIVNRVARPFYSEALRLLDESYANCATIDAAMTQVGFKMGPFTLMDFIGHDVNYLVTESVYQALYYDPRFKPSLSQKRLLEAGYLGKKSGRGFYRYNLENTDPESNAIDHSKLEYIANRILAMLINEAADALFLNIATKEDLELAMTKGVNYPKGLMAWGEEIGWQQVAHTLDQLYHYYHEDRYRLSPWIRNKIAN